MITVAPLAPDQRAASQQLFEGYMDFCERVQPRGLGPGHQSNVAARRLYDAVAEYRGFIRYQIEPG